MPDLRRLHRRRPEDRGPRPSRVAQINQPLRGALQHPVDRTEARRSPFDRFSERVSFLASSSVFFALCVGLVLVWAVGLALGASNKFEAFAAGLMSSATLILVAVLKNSELRSERALQTKLDAIAASLLDDRRGREGDAEDQLERSIRIQEEI